MHGPARPHLRKAGPSAGAHRHRRSQPGGGFYPGRKPLSRTGCSRGTRSARATFSSEPETIVTKPASAAATLAAPCPSLFSDSGSLAQDLVEAFLAVRNETERRAAPLTPEDQLIQSMPDASPAKWHRAHTTWFFEQFLLGEHCAGLQALSPGLRLSVQFLLCQRRPASRPPPARPSDPSRRRRDHRLPPACRRRRGEILSRGRRGHAGQRSRRWSKSASITSSSIRN